MVRRRILIATVVFASLMLWAAAAVTVRASWRGMPWVRSMTRASGVMRAMTPWHTPTNSSSWP